MGSAVETRRRLVEASSEVFAEHGVYAASLVEITRRAGQRNRGAVHYHFGSREGLVVAVLERHSAFLATRAGELLERARHTPDSDLAAVVEAIVRPAVELAETGVSGRQFLVVVDELIEEYDRIDPAVADALSATGGDAVYDLLERRMPQMETGLRNERLTLMTTFILRAVAVRARTDQDTASRRTQLPTEQFVTNLVAMAAGMAQASIDV